MGNESGPRDPEFAVRGIPEQSGYDFITTVAALLSGPAPAGGGSAYGATEAHGSGWHYPILANSRVGNIPARSGSCSMIKREYLLA